MLIIYIGILVSLFVPRLLQMYLSNSSSAMLICLYNMSRMVQCRRYLSPKKTTLQKRQRSSACKVKGIQSRQDRLTLPRVAGCLLRTFHPRDPVSAFVPLAWKIPVAAIVHSQQLGQLLVGPPLEPAQVRGVGDAVDDSRMSTVWLRET